MCAKAAWKQFVGARDKLPCSMQSLEMLHRHRCCNACGPARAGEDVNTPGYVVSANARRLCAQEPVDEVEGEGAVPGPAPRDAVLEPEPPVDGLAACLPLFTAGSGHRRFIRTLKPVAGSSFKARPQAMRLLAEPIQAPMSVAIGWLCNLLARQALRYHGCRAPGIDGQVAASSSVACPI